MCVQAISLYVSIDIYVCAHGVDLERERIHGLLSRRVTVMVMLAVWWWERWDPLAPRYGSSWRHRRSPKSLFLLVPTRSLIILYIYMYVYVCM